MKGYYHMYNLYFRASHQNQSKIIMKNLLFLFLFCCGFISAQNEPIAQKGIPTIIDLFKEKAIVAIGETHGHQQLYDFLDKLIQTEGFYKNVNDILIESGNAFYQETLDKYIFGENVAFEDLQKVWLNTTQSPVDPWSVDVYYKLLKTIRVLNSKVARDHRIRVIAADPPMDWKLINSLEDYETTRGSRDAYYAQTVIDKVLLKGRKALLINGGAHFGNHSPKKNKVNQRIEKLYPNSITVVLATSGLWKGNEAKEAQLNWSLGTIAKVKNTWIGLLPGPRRMMMSATSTGNTQAIATAPTAVSTRPPSKNKRQDYFEYLLYFGSRKAIRYGTIDPSIYQSDKLWKELNRRSFIRFNHKLIEATRATGELRPEAYN